MRTNQKPFVLKVEKNKLVKRLICILDIMY